MKTRPRPAHLLAALALILVIAGCGNTPSQARGAFKGVIAPTSAPPNAR